MPKVCWESESPRSINDVLEVASVHLENINLAFACKSKSRLVAEQCFQTRARVRDLDIARWPDGQSPLVLWHSNGVLEELIPRKSMRLCSMCYLL